MAAVAVEALLAPQAHADKACNQHQARWSQPSLPKITRITDPLTGETQQAT